MVHSHDDTIIVVHYILTSNIQVIMDITYRVLFYLMAACSLGCPVDSFQEAPCDTNANRVCKRE